MNHLLCVRDVVQAYGIPLAYYTDRHSIFTFSERQDSWKMRFQMAQEDAQVQWKRVMELLKIQHILAQSPQAKGKVESKFKYLQGRLVRRCAKEEVTTLEHAQNIVNQEVMYYNEHRLHSITGQTPKHRWDLAQQEGRSLLRPFELEAEKSWKDIFCLEYQKTLDKYGKFTVKRIPMKIKSSPSQTVTVHYVKEGSNTEIRVLSHGVVLKTFTI